MSDRTQSSVRPESPVGDAAASSGTASGEPTPASATQSIPSTGAQKAQGAGAGASSPATVRPVGGPPGAPPVPPATGSAPAAGASTADSSVGPRSRKSAGRGPRRARLQLRHIDTWSALKISLVLSIALFFIWMVAVGVLYGVLNALGVFDTLNELFGQLGSDTGSDTGNEVLTPGVGFGGAAIIGAINIVLLTAL